MPEMDDILRQSLQGSVPQLPPGFANKVVRQITRSRRSAQWLLFLYAAMSLLVSVIVMRSQGLAWSAIAASTLGPIAILAAALGWARNSKRVAG